LAISAMALNDFDVTDTCANVTVTWRKDTNRGSVKIT